jgi:hypothetical protein
VTKNYSTGLLLFFKKGCRVASLKDGTRHEGCLKSLNNVNTSLVLGENNNAIKIKLGKIFRTLF